MNNLAASVARSAIIALRGKRYNTTKTTIKGVAHG